MKQNAIALEEEKKKKEIGGELGDLRLTNEKDFSAIKLWNLYFTRDILLLLETEMA